MRSQMKESIEALLKNETFLVHQHHLYTFKSNYAGSVCINQRTVVCSFVIIGIKSSDFLLKFPQRRAKVKDERTALKKRIPEAGLK